MTARGEKAPFYWNCVKGVLFNFSIQHFSEIQTRFIVGVQAAMVPLGSKGFYFAPMKLTLNVHTAAGFFGVLMALVNFAAVVIWFSESKIDIYDGQQKVDVDTGEETFSLYVFYYHKGSV